MIAYNDPSFEGKPSPVRLGGLPHPCGNDTKISGSKIRNAPPVTVPQYSCLKTSRFGLTPTAVVTVSSCGGKSVGQFRALVDSGAQTNLITYDLAQTLGLRLLPENVILSGVGDRKTLVRYRAIAILHTRSDKRIPFTASVIDQVGAPLPNRDWDSAYWPHVLPVKSRLADPDFSTSRGTDLLLGVDIMSKVLLGPAGPDLWDTDLGLLVVGQLPPRPKKSVRIHPYDHVHPFYQDSPTTVIQPHPSLVKERSSAAAYSASVTPHVFSSPPFLVENYHKIALKEIVEIIRQGYGNPKSCRTSSPCPLLESQPPLPEESQSPSKPKLLSIKDVPVSPSIVRNLFSVVPPVSTDECNLKLFNISDTARTADMQLVQPSIIHFSSAVSSAPTSVMAKTSTIVIEDLLRQMFEIESVEPVRPWTPEEEKAEQLFLNSVHRDDCGRYVVSLPFSEPPESLGESRHIALRQLYRLEARLKRNPVLAKAYQEFMAEYLELGHMRRLEPLDVKHSPNYYIPHHAVHREGDPPERIRVVFNASQRTSNGRSLNEILLVGPKLQSEISCMITRFRSFRYVFISDIRQMFRQIRHPESDHDMLRIVWRNSSDEPIQDFALCTVTYGTTSAPFLANRVVQHLAEEGSVSHPTASRILREHTYVDDVHGGGSSLEEALLARTELIDLLGSAQLELRKWASNCEQVLEGIPLEHRLARSVSVDMSDDEGKPLKMLGIAWDPSSDTFFFKVPSSPVIHTKRELASQVGKIYDPVGWVMPVSVYARSIQREICRSKFDWDDPLPLSLASDWSKLASSLHQLQTLSIPRHIAVDAPVQWLVGFSDASERAYASVVYHVAVQNGSFTTRLILARAKIAPMKPESIPRLELLAAELLGKTMTRVRQEFPHIPSSNVIACSDSTVALSWITAEPAPLWKVFVGNRVAKILSHLPKEHWFHVRSAENSADVASRGALPEQLMTCQLWWNGPVWLQSDRSSWPIKRIRPDLNLGPVSDEIRASSSISVTAVSETPWETRFSSYSKLRRVTAWMLRFISNCKNKGSCPVKSTSVRQPLTTDELRHADIILVRMSQRRSLLDVNEAIDKNQRPTKLMKQLAIFRDDQGVLRVGGRLSNMPSPYETQHPALVKPSDLLAPLLIRHAHVNCLHVGPRATLAHLRNRYWLIDGRNSVNRILAGCTRCFTVKPKPFQPEMGHLPSARVTRAFVFQQTGIDFCGPFTVTVAGLRGMRSIEVYLAVFVCFSVKAIHLEIVMDLSTDGFLQCLERFMGRRGVPSVIWSDNGRNFVGAANLLRKIRQSSSQDDCLENSVTERMANRGVEWKFIPPRAPHFGGLWEAAVKSAKRLIKVNLRDHTPTLQTFSTIVVRIEAILNSRPLVYQNASPDDVLILTPGHFLVQRPLTALPESNCNDVSSRLIPKWKFVSSIVQSFWKRWQSEYLLDLQTRQKWNTPDRPAVVGDVVLIREDNTPPLSWPMGVITDLVPGGDGIARVARVRTVNGEKTRPLVRLCPLPKEE
ncbi:Retrotransposon protein [Nesidiocoris tenuis]|uniref:Retrotransposon protein n=1 Tax=Nesidiocoris tenuis TaxID=355587 RepID=A0ABN7APU0_9HEMI|nr:Retrotransposon protein [Nesidiocoris tenuis]